MSDRQRKRAELRKRKRRGAERVPAPAPPEPEPAPSRSEIKDAEAREALEPLREGERPGIVTAAAIISGIVALLSVAGWVLWDTLRDDPRPPFGGPIVILVLFGVMAWGLWHARYWAVLGFQTVLVFVLVLTALGIVQATTVLEAAGDVVIIAVAGFLFYRMIKAMARIQMPQRLPRE